MAQRTAGKEKQSEHGHRAVEKYVVTQAKQWKGECEHCDVKATGYESKINEKRYTCVSLSSRIPSLCFLNLWMPCTFMGCSETQTSRLGYSWS
jgi:hypothetical protein